MGIGLFVATTGTAEWLGVILLALSAIHAFAAVAAWPLTTGAAVLPFDPLALPLQFLLTLVPILALLPIGAWTPWITRLLRGICRFRCGLCDSLDRPACCNRCCNSRCNRRLRQTLRAPRTMWAPLRTSAGTSAGAAVESFAGAAGATVSTGFGFRSMR